MDKPDWKNCWGEVFQIFRKKAGNGHGYVRVGDTVGIYYRRSKTWFGCAGRYCGWAGCPGKPTYAHGFNKPAKWNQCWGEVFKIYARGRSVGSIIRPNDSIMLYYPREKKFVGQVGNHPDKRTCPGPKLPPPANKYDRCWGEVFEIWLGPHFPI